MLDFDVESTRPRMLVYLALEMSTVLLVLVDKKEFHSLALSGKGLEHKMPGHDVEGKNRGALVTAFILPRPSKAIDVL